MFTGIITDRGVVKAIEAPDRTVADARFTFETAYDTAAIPEGASIACSGVCLTVVDKGSEGGRGWFAADVSGETLARSTLADWRPGTPVHFERPLKLGDEPGGHVVSGHVVGVAPVRSRQTEQGSLRPGLQAPPQLATVIAPHGAADADGGLFPHQPVQD